MEPSSSHHFRRRRGRRDLVERTDLSRALEVEPQKCSLFRCFCCWRRHCSPSIPPVMPHRDYISGPRPRRYGSPQWSVVIGCTSSEPFRNPRFHDFGFGLNGHAMVDGQYHHDLRLHRFSVAVDGRIIGHNNDLLEVISDVFPKMYVRKITEFDSAVVSLLDNSLYVICAQRPVLNELIDYSGGGAEISLPPKPFVMDIRNKTLCKHSLPRLPFSAGSYQAVSAWNRLWVPAILRERRSSKEVTGHLFNYQLVVYVLAKDDRSWSEVKRVDFPYKSSLESGCDSSFLNVEPGYGGSTLQGYAVIRNRFILLSFINSSTRFVSFDCFTGDLIPVTIDNKSRTHQYVPILGKGVHVEETNTIYFVRGTKLFAYKYPLEKDDPLAPPIEIDTIWPFHEEGYGFIVSLSGNILCAVWINMDRPCGCTTRHAIISTFFVKGIADDKTGSFVPNAIVILHSTCRRIDMLRTEAAGYECYDNFCFLQEYVCYEGMSSTRSSVMKKLSYPQAETFPDCCRDFLSKESERGKGLIMLEECKMATKSNFYFICQVDERSILYKISTSGGKFKCHDKVLEELLCLETSRLGDIILDYPSAWYLAHNGSILDVIPSMPGSDHYVVDVERKSYQLQKSKRSKLIFSAVFKVGECIVSLGNTLQDVYVLNRRNYQWRRQKAVSSSIDLSWKIKISGFVDLAHDAFMISDASTTGLFLFDLKSGEWFAVELPRDDFLQSGLLSGRCIFAEGFVYSCSDCGLVAFELIRKDNSFRLGLPILLELTWKKICGDSRFMSFDSICKDQIRDSIMFCIVQGYFRATPFTSCHTVAITTVQVRLKEIARGLKEPVGVGHVDISLSFIREKGRILTNYAFAL